MCILHSYFADISHISIFPYFPHFLPVVPNAPLAFPPRLIHNLPQPPNYILSFIVSPYLSVSVSVSVTFSLYVSLLFFSLSLVASTVVLVSQLIQLTSFFFIFISLSFIHSISKLFLFPLNVILVQFIYCLNTGKQHGNINDKRGWCKVMNRK